MKIILCLYNMIIIYYLAGALRLSSRFIDGKSNKIVFSECVSSNNCSAPKFDRGLHLNK